MPALFQKGFNFSRIVQKYYVIAILKNINFDWMVERIVVKEKDVWLSKYYGQLGFI